MSCLPIKCFYYFCVKKAWSIKKSKSIESIGIAIIFTTNDPTIKLVINTAIIGNVNDETTGGKLVP